MNKYTATYRISLQALAYADLGGAALTCLKSINTAIIS